MSFSFFSIEQILELHRVSIEMEGGKDGIRDQAVLESTVMAPQATFDGDYLHHSIQEIAAAYLYYICQNHPCFDGNKRTAVRAALVYLHIHHIHLDLETDTFEHFILSVAQGNEDKGDILRFFNQYQL